jgi:hypothetical protein
MEEPSLPVGSARPVPEHRQAGSIARQPSMILVLRMVPGAKRHGRQKWEPTHSAAPDPARRSQNPLPGQGLPVRLSPTVTDTPNFPDTEDVTGSNPVRPTQFDLAFSFPIPPGHALRRYNWPYREGGGNVPKSRRVPDDGDPNVNTPFPAPLPHGP